MQSRNNPIICYTVKSDQLKAMRQVIYNFSDTAEDTVFFETTHGCYSDYGFTFAGRESSIESAKSKMDANPSLFINHRIVNKYGDVLYDPNKLSGIYHGIV